MHRVTARHCFLPVAALCGLSVSSAVAAALRDKAEKRAAKPQVSPGEKSAFGIAPILCEDIAPRIEP